MFSMKELQMGKSASCRSQSICTRSFRCNLRQPLTGKSCQRQLSRQLNQCRKRSAFRCRATERAEADVEAPSTSNGDQPVDSQTLQAILKQAEQDFEEGVFDIQKLSQQIQSSVSASEASHSEQLQNANTEATNKYLRLSADFDNFRKRVATERERQSDQVRGDVVKALIPLVDTFEAAQASIKADGESPAASAYQGLYKQMVDIFKSLGVEAVPGAGQPFDPEFHDAILREENNEVPNGTVLQELRRGFRMGKTLLRPSMVKVSYSEDSSEGAQPAIDV